MKGAYLLAEHDGLFTDAAAVLRSRETVQFENEEIIQVTDDLGHLLMLDGVVPAVAEWEYRSAPDAVAPGVERPDLDRVTACLVECRSEEWFISVMATLAEGLRYPAWVLDGDGMLWATGDIDPSRLTL